MSVTTRALKPLPELLREQQLIPPEQLQQAQAEAARSGVPLRRLLIGKGLITEPELAALLASQCGLSTIDLANRVIKPEVVGLVPEILARKHALMPVFKIGDVLTVAVSDPLNVFAIDEVRLKTKCEIKTVVAGESDIRHAIDHYYGASGTIAEVAEAIKASATATEEDAAAEAPVIRLVDLLIMQAMKEQASDIHIEPGDGVLRTRFRTDGLLREVAGAPARLHAAVVSRIKVLAKLDIAEKRKPQDGRFRLSVDNTQIDLRVSTVPTQFGEKVVMRLLNSAGGHLNLEQLGLEEPLRSQVDRLIHLPHGILLVTGPTGSGKTTTLYAALSIINAVERNILTIEDPIEYQLPGINQVQVNPKADVTFASALRAFLRQDPNVIMVGEIRDRETSEIAIQAALTGHLVLSTLHTNDAPSSLTRLIDMGVEPFLIASSMVGVLAQRLVRVICPKCKEPCAPDTHLAQELGAPAGSQLFKGRGCLNCKQTGYRGRLGIFELLTITDAIKELVATKAPVHAIRAAAREHGMRTLREDGMDKALRGLTSADEVLRVTQLE